MGTYEEETLKGQMYGLTQLVGNFINAMMVMLPGGREAAIQMCEKYARDLPDGFIPEGSTSAFREGVKKSYGDLAEAIRSARGFNA